MSPDLSMLDMNCLREIPLNSRIFMSIWTSTAISIDSFEFLNQGN